MKKTLLIALCFPMIVWGQTTYVPDDNFEAYLESNGMGNGTLNDNLVLTANINTVSDLYLSFEGISDLTGVEDFSWLENLYCNNNNLTTLDVSYNQYLLTLDCSNNFLSTLDVYGATWLLDLYCDNNFISTLDLSSNVDLSWLDCGNNQLTALDVSSCSFLDFLWCNNNQLASLDVRNGANINMFFNSQSNPNLSCINVDDAFWSTNNWTSIDPWTGFSTNCPPVVFGCTDVTACNYNSLANVDDGSCDLPNGCGDILYLEYDPTVTCPDANACINIIVSGCTDVTACNYNSLANVDDGSCDLPNGCGDALYLEYDPTVTCPDPNACINLIVSGCMNATACNYNSLANVDDGSCIYLDIISTATNVSCNGSFDGSIVATATGGVFPLQYSLGAGLSQTSGTFLNLSAGTYYVDVTDANGCASNQMLVITEPNPLFVNAFSTDISCFGYCDGSAFSMPSGGTLPYSYLWSNGNITDNISGLCAGAYVVNITDANNCVNIETVVISEPPPLVLNNTINGCDSVLIGSNYYTISGAYTDTLTSVNGCDSVVNTNLTIGQNTHSYDTLSVTASIVWNGMSLNISGDYSVTLINSVGCDSIVALNLTVTTTGTSEIANKSKVVKITDMLGKETPYRRNTPLFYIYNDGTVEKRIVIE